MRQFHGLTLGAPPALRVVVALVAVVGLFVLMREWYDGWCVLPIYDDRTIVRDLARFLTLPTFFLASMVWLVAELTHPIARASGAPPGRARILSIGVGLAVYAAVGLIVWLSSPTLPDDIGGHEDWPYQVVYGVFWPLGILAHLDTFSTVWCGA